MATSGMSTSRNSQLIRNSPVTTVANKPNVMLHSQPEDFESFYVIQGQVTLFLEGQEPVEASAGSYAYVPAGLPHAFRVTSETAGVLNYTTPLHEQFFLAVADPAPSFELPPEGPPDIERLEAAAQRFGVEILGPPPGASN